MIELTRLNGHKFSVNCELIKYVETAPDTTLTLVTGEKILVAEAREAVVASVLESRAQTLRIAWPEGTPSFAAKHTSDSPPGSRRSESESLFIAS